MSSILVFLFMRNGGGRERRETGSKSGVNKGTRLESTYQ